MFFHQDTFIVMVMFNIYSCRVPPAYTVFTTADPTTAILAYVWIFALVKDPDSPIDANFV